MTDKQGNGATYALVLMVVACCFMVTSCEQFRIKTNKELKIETSLIIGPSRDKSVAP